MTKLQEITSHLFRNPSKLATSYRHNVRERHTGFTIPADQNHDVLATHTVSREAVVEVYFWYC